MATYERDGNDAVTQCSSGRGTRPAIKNEQVKCTVFACDSRVTNLSRHLSGVHQATTEQTTSILKTLQDIKDVEGGGRGDDCLRHLECPEELSGEE